MLKQNYYMHNENSNVTIIGDISGMTGSPVTSNIGDITTMKKMIEFLQEQNKTLTEIIKKDNTINLEPQRNNGSSNEYVNDITTGTVYVKHISEKTDAVTPQYSGIYLQNLETMDKFMVSINAGIDKICEQLSRYQQMFEVSHAEVLRLTDIVESQQRTIDYMVRERPHGYVGNIINIGDVSGARIDYIRKKK